MMNPIKVDLQKQLLWVKGTNDCQLCFAKLIDLLSRCYFSATIVGIPKLSEDLYTITLGQSSRGIAATQKIDELGNIGDDRSFLSLKVIFLRVATLTGSVTLFVSNHPRQSDSHYLSFTVSQNS